MKNVDRPVMPIKNNCSKMLGLYGLESDENKVRILFLNFQSNHVIISLQSKACNLIKCTLYPCMTWQNWNILLCKINLSVYSISNWTKDELCYVPSVNTVPMILPLDV